MLGLNLIIHALKMLFHDFWMLVRLTFLPLSIGFAILFGMVFTMSAAGVFDFNPGETGSGGPDGRVVLAAILGAVIFAFTFFWAAVGWHRYVLLGETPAGLVPSPNLAMINFYFWASVRLVLMLLVLMIPVLLLIFLLMGSFGMDLATGRVLTFLLMVPVSAVLFRLAVVLPGAAVGKPMSLGDGWQATSGHFSTFIVVALASMAINQLSGIAFGGGIAGLIIGAVLSWLSLVVGISVLTTLYGYFVERRALG